VAGGSGDGSANNATSVGTVVVVVLVVLVLEGGNVIVSLTAGTEVVDEPAGVDEVVLRSVDDEMTVVVGPAVVAGEDVGLGSVVEVGGVDEVVVVVEVVHVIDVVVVGRPSRSGRRSIAIGGSVGSGRVQHAVRTMDPVRVHTEEPHETLNQARVRHNPGRCRRRRRRPHRGQRIVGRRRS